jgi:hypothetical protein
MMSPRRSGDETPEQSAKGRRRLKRGLLDGVITIVVVVLLGFSELHWPIVWWVVLGLAVILLVWRGTRRWIDWRQDVRWEREARGSD